MLRRIPFSILLFLMFVLWGAVGWRIVSRETLDKMPFDPQVNERERED